MDIQAHIGYWQSQTHLEKWLVSPSHINDLRVALNLSTLVQAERIAAACDQPGSFGSLSELDVVLPDGIVLPDVLATLPTMEQFGLASARHVTMPESRGRD